MSSSIQPTQSQKRGEVSNSIRVDQREVILDTRTKKIWDSVFPYLIPVVAASAAIVPAFYGFVVKSAQQVGNPIPRMSMREAFVGGLRASPTIGMIVGTQMGVQKVVENAMDANQNNSSDIASKLASSLVVGAVSSPLLAVFNGQTMGKTMMSSLRSLTAVQAGAIVARETSFLFALAINDPMAAAMKRKFGDHKAVEYSSSFIGGAIGSLIGHPADTALTLWQKGMTVDCFRSLMRGAPAKAVAVGIFNVGFQVSKGVLS